MERHFYYDAGLGAWLVTTPVWSWLLHDISVVMQFVATLSGAIIGSVTVYRMLKALFGTCVLCVLVRTWLKRKIRHGRS